MAYNKKASANFMECLSPNGNFHGTDIQGVDQAAQQARMRLREDHGNMDRDWQERQRDYQAEGILEKRKQRGGQTFRKGDMLAE